MKLMPVMTEKGLKLSKEGVFTFWVSTSLTKIEIKKIIEEGFSVHVTNVRTINYKAGVKKNARGKVQKVKGAKKAIISLKEGEKIDLFEEEKKKAKKKRSTKA